jgi:ribosomal protein RSM22 (predicted rRNA methylase)
MTSYSIPQGDQKLIDIFSVQNNLNLQAEADLRKIAQCVLKTSDYFIDNPLGQTPWEKIETRIAYIYYFSPLNSVRMHRILSQHTELLQKLSIESIVDFGAGLGSGGRTLQSFFPEAELSLVEQSEIPISLLKSSGVWKGFSSSLISNTKNRNTIVCSYSLTELSELPDWLTEFENIILLEPATQSDGRRLLGWRHQLLQAGYFVWAPCTHQDLCPLLTESKTDWCHDRAHFDGPEWFLNMEQYLPMKNRTLATSYLILSKQKPPEGQPQMARLTGDLLKEKGKDRQMVCRKNKREFLAWLHKHGPHPEYYRGDLIELPTNLTEVSNELRFTQK